MLEYLPDEGRSLRTKSRYYELETCGTLLRTNSGIIYLPVPMIALLCCCWRVFLLGSDGREYEYDGERVLAVGPYPIRELGIYLN
jgi:hypothetical protein